MSAGATSPNADESAAPVFTWEGVRIDVDRTKITTYNFRNPGFLSASDLRQLEMLHARFGDHLSARLSTFLRMECAAKMTYFNSSTFARFVESIKSPTHLVLFQVESLRGIGVLDVSLNLGLALADRILGGKGRVAEPVRNLSEIENALIEEAIQDRKSVV